MPIVVTTPSSGGQFGPGFTVIAHTDSVGPFPSDTQWSFILTAPANEEIIIQRTIVTNQTNITIDLVNTGAFGSFVAGARTEWAHGHSGQLQVQFYTPSTGFLEVENVPIELDRISGQVRELQVWLNSHVATAGQGLTTEEHDAVLQTQAATMAAAGINPLEYVAEVVQAIASHNPLGYGSLSEVFVLSGDGEMPDPEPLLVKWGIYWVAVTIPPGLSHQHGQSEEYPARLVQWRTVHEVGGTEMVTSILDAETHGELWKFPTQTPRRVEYSIIPGVVLHAQWWQFP